MKLKSTMAALMTVLAPVAVTGFSAAQAATVIMPGDTVNLSSDTEFTFDPPMVANAMSSSIAFTADSATAVKATLDFSALIAPSGPNPGVFFSDSNGNVLASFDLSQSTSSVTFDILSPVGAGDEIILSLNIGGGKFVDLALSIETADPVPLPAALPLFAAGLGAVGFARRRKAKKSA